GGARRPGSRAGPRRARPGDATRALVLVLVERQRFPAGETLVDAVPVGDFVLADLPTEEHLLVAAKGWEVDEATVEVLDEDAQALELLDAPRDGLALALEQIGRASCRER